MFKGSAFCLTAVAAWLASGLALDAQTLGNQSLKSNYFFRYVSMVANATGSIGDARSIQGSITFDGAGSYTFTGQQVTGVAASVAASGTGTYSVDPAGVVSLTSPLRAGDFVNARLGPEALIGSGTENTDSAFDLFVAIPAAASSGAFSGPYSRRFHCQCHQHDFQSADLPARRVLSRERLRAHAKPCQRLPHHPSDLQRRLRLCG
jgi:hypothetical protein